MPNSAPALENAINHDGFAIVPDVLPPALAGELREISGTGTARRRGASTYGSRNLLAAKNVRNLAANEAIRSLIRPIVGEAAIPVRAIFFDKTPEANWPVLWHQDLTIAVAERHDLEGWTNWSVKAGVTHVEAPAALLAAMLTIRLHLDDCHAGNGPLRVIPGSHTQGRLTRDRIQAIRQATPETTCIARRLSLADAPAPTPRLVPRGQTRPPPRPPHRVRAGRCPAAAALVGVCLPGRLG